MRFPDLSCEKEMASYPFLSSVSVASSDKHGSTSYSENAFFVSGFVFRKAVRTTVYFSCKPAWDTLAVGQL